ncbi:MAG: hypothetical protein J1E80_06575 [Desulfovibrionaceae bacterium]|nr:hypothetical protein [Desulfovibrionaceae bacterium]
MPRKQVSFPVTDKEHEQIKQLAKSERRTIKQLVLSAFDKLYPGWNGERKESGSK